MNAGDERPGPVMLSAAVAGGRPAIRVSQERGETRKRTRGVHVEYLAVDPADGLAFAARLAALCRALLTGAPRCRRPPADPYPPSMGSPAISDHRPAPGYGGGEDA